MLRTFIVAVLALGLFTSGLALAGDEAKKKGKKGKGNTGAITRVDADKGTITVSVKVKKNTEDREFKVNDKTEVFVKTKKATTPIKADKVADLLKKEQFKEGAQVTIETGEDGTTAKKITFVSKKKKKNQ